MADEVIHMKTETELIITFEHRFGGWPARVKLVQGSRGYQAVSLMLDSDKGLDGEPLPPRINEVPADVLRKILALLDGLPMPPNVKSIGR